MGHHFTFAETDSLPVQAPGWRAPMDAAWLEADERYQNAAPEESGHYGCAYGWSGQIVDALTASGVLIAMDHRPWPAQVYVDEHADEPVPTPEGLVFLRQGAGELGRVPSWKFDGNPWIFTPQECAWMADALQTHPNSDLRVFGCFCAAAAQHGGMMVE